MDALGAPRTGEVRTGKSGRAHALMYDLSGIKKGETSTVKEDWLKLKARNITSDAGYLHHDGKISFLDLEGLPSDYYLRLAGAGGKLLRGEIPADSERPAP